MITKASTPEKRAKPFVILECVAAVTDVVQEEGAVGA
jgi:hypothetical protein